MATPHCKDCFWYEEKEDKNKFLDGWCKNKYQRTHGINGRKLDKPRDVSVRWMWCCSQWEDAEDRLTKYEVVTGKVEEWRKGLDRERVEEILRPYNEMIDEMLAGLKKRKDGVR